MKLRQTQFAGLCIAGTLGMACSGTPAPNGSNQGLGWQTSVGGASAGGDTSGTEAVGGASTAGGAGAGGVANAGGTTGTGGVDAGGDGKASLLQDAQEYQGEYPEPGAVTYTDTNGQGVSLVAIPGHVVLFVAPNVAQSEATAMLVALGAEVRACLPKMGYYLAGTKPGDEGQLISALRKDVRTWLASPDIAIGPESLRPLHTLDNHCSSPLTEPVSCLLDKSEDRTRHGLHVVWVLNRYTDGKAAGICQDISPILANSSISGTKDAFSAVAWAIATILSASGDRHSSIFHRVPVEAKRSRTFQPMTAVRSTK
jgi:hypothetical protein